ncbi:hypothetical protein [Streptomyces werraensis]|uniref:hypothetical protein n=1 Tax=Streptomyces werraensis TaxID=68284 RepID=UPI0034157EE5
MSTAVTSPSPPAPSSLRTTGSAERHTLAPAPPATGTAPAPLPAGAPLNTTVSEFTHGVTTSLGR